LITGSKPMISMKRQIARAITKPMTWLRESADANTPTATQAPESRSDPR